MKLKLKVFGDETFKIFNVDASIINKDEETFLTTGTVDIVNNQTVLNLEAVFDNFNIIIIYRFNITNIFKIFFFNHTTIKFLFIYIYNFWNYNYLLLFKQSNLISLKWI